MSFEHSLYDICVTVILLCRKNLMEAELVRSKNDMMSLNNQLLEAIQRKLELSQELEAWQVGSLFSLWSFLSIPSSLLYSKPIHLINIFKMLIITEEKPFLRHAVCSFSDDLSRKETAVSQFGALSGRLRTDAAIPLSALSLWRDINGRCLCLRVLLLLSHYAKPSHLLEGLISCVLMNVMQIILEPKHWLIWKNHVC